MDERTLQTRVGVVVIAAMILTGIMVLAIDEFSEFTSWFGLSPRRTVAVYFPSAGGVIEGTPVEKFGKRIGRVKSVEIMSEEPLPVKVTLDLDADQKVYHEEICRISEPLFGETVVEFVGSTGGKRTEIMGEKPISGVVVGNPLDAVTNLEGDLQKTLDSFSRAGDKVSELADNFNAMLGGDEDERQLDEILTLTKEALIDFNRAVDNVNAVIGQPDQQQALQKTVADLPQVLEKLDRTLTEFQGVADRANRNLENIEVGVTEPLRERGERIVMNLDNTVENINVITQSLEELSAGVNGSEGTLGRLLNDPELYDQLNAAAANINRIALEMRPVVSDVRVFTDKIARDPGQLGVRGALQRPRSPAKYPNIGNVQPPPIDWRIPRDQQPQQLPWKVVPAPGESW